jgi:protein-S-isoprenylcysteine O-methyltransferase Ste14
MAESRLSGSNADWSKVARRIRVPLGFAFAVLYLWLAHPTWRFIGLGAIAIVPGLLIRAFASGHVRKNEALATTGPYAYTRNPLYLGSLLIGVGFAIAARSWWIGLALLVMFFAIYVPVIRGEEKFLRERFPEFDEYAHHVPRMLPRMTTYRRAEDSGRFSMQLYLKHREWNALLGALAMIAALVLKMLFLRTN